MSPYLSRRLRPLDEVLRERDPFALGGRQKDADHPELNPARERTARFVATFEALDPPAKDAVESAALALARRNASGDVA
jgi:hypothetical protein